MVDTLDVSEPPEQEATDKSTASVKHRGVEYPLVRDPRSRMWRIRKRTKDVKIDVSLRTRNLRCAKDAAKAHLDKKRTEVARKQPSSVTLREVCNIYERMPKRANEDVAKANVQRFAKVVDVAWGKSLEDVKLSELNASLWEDYSAKRQGRESPDLATRTEANRGINSAIRIASSIFTPKLERSYEREGLCIDLSGINKIQWLPEVRVKVLPLEAEKLKALHAALPALKVQDHAKWRAVMIARHSGLRSGEISASHKDWLRKSKAGVWGFEVCDRPEQGYLHKTGEDYFAPITSKELLDDLLQGPDGRLVVIPGKDRDWFFDVRCNQWIRQFIPRPHKGLHRLRALYLEEIKDMRAAEVMAEREGIEAARSAAGHTSSTTTKRHYLPATV